MNFDEMIDRRQYPTMKWGKAFLAEHFGNESAIPMSVADMDFKAPPSVIKSLLKRAAHGIYGYEFKPDSYYAALQAWYQNRHGWKINPQELEPSPSILSAISVLIDQHSDEGDGVILQTPVFFEFRMVIRENQRKIIKNPLKFIDGRYRMDFDDLETKASDPKNKILILCNPHNPVGRVWTEAELKQVLEICERNDIFVIADEIHGDFTFSPHRYVPYLSISEKSAQNSVACISPAKTFNIAGMVDAIAVIPNEKHREEFHAFAHRYQINKVNVFTSAATESAYQNGDEWLDELTNYLQGNVGLIRDFLNEKNLGVSLIEPEGTFLVWLDFRALGLDAKELEVFLAKEAALALAPGYWFGREGAGFARMTIGCPRERVQNALNNLETALKKRAL